MSKTIENTVHIVSANRRLVYMHGRFVYSHALHIFIYVDMQRKGLIFAHR